MSHHRTGITFVLALGLAVAACERPPTAPDGLDTPAFSAASAQVQFTSEHIFLFDAAIPADFAAGVAAAGGTIVRTHPEIAVAVASGLTDGAATALAVGGVAARDVLAQWLPPLGAPQLQSVPGDVVAQGHDPTTAFFYPFQWDMHQINAQGAWAAGASGAGVRVAILDTGLDPFHTDMVGLIDAGSSVAFVNSLNGAGPTWGDDNFHGTHVGGSVVTNGFGTSGVAPHTQLIAVKVLNVFGGGTFGWIIGGIMHAADVDADIINMSLGGYFAKNLPGGGTLVAALNRAVNYANAVGTLVISASGNNARDLDRDRNGWQIPCQSGAGICISSTGPADVIASYSNFGRSAIHVAGPGGDFNGSFLNTVLSPCSTLSLLIPICSLNNFYLFLQGTSMAAPHAAGVAALIANKYGASSSPAVLKSQMAQSAFDLGKPGADPFYGRGRIDAYMAVK